MADGALVTKKDLAVLVCGGRYYQNTKQLYRIMDAIQALYGFKILIHGGATGADELAGKWAQERDLKKIVVKAKWEKYGKSAGPLRNQAMLDMFAPDLIIAFEGGAGTADMVRRAKLAGVPVKEIHVQD